MDLAKLKDGLILMKMLLALLAFFTLLQTPTSFAASAKIKCRIVETPLDDVKLRTIDEYDLETADSPTPIKLKVIKHLVLSILDTSGGIGKTKVPQITINVDDLISGNRITSIALMSSVEPKENGNLNVIFVRKNQDSLGVVCALVEATR